MSKILHGNESGLHVRLARSPDEVLAAQRLRYQVFYEERGAVPDDRMRAERRESDPYDDFMDHLIVVDPNNRDVEAGIVGNYRLLRGDVAERHGEFYTSHEFNIDGITSSGQKLLELGRSCVMEGYRTMPVLQLLWNGIAAYVTMHEIGLMFGCASFQGTDPTPLREQLSYLHHYHLTEEPLRPTAFSDNAISMDMMPKDDIDVRRARAALEPLIKGYLRLGASIGENAFVDRQFNTIDVCIVMPTERLSSRYMKHYERKLQQPMVTPSSQSAPAAPATAT